MVFHAFLLRLPEDGDLSPKYVAELCGCPMILHKLRAFVGVRA